MMILNKKTTNLNMIGLGTLPISFTFLKKKVTNLINFEKTTKNLLMQSIQFNKLPSLLKMNTLGFSFINTCHIQQQYSVQNTVLD
jgi:uncharacterized protein YybS (DUF2232 family)